MLVERTTRYTMLLHFPQTSSGETYAATLEQMQPGSRITIFAPADHDARVLSAAELSDFDAVFLTGSPQRGNDALAMACG